MDRVSDSQSLQIFSPEFDAIHRSCLATEDSLQLVQSEIESLKIRMTELRLQEEDLQYRIKRYKAALALPNRLPTEILRYIFRFLCAGQVYLPPKDNGNVFTISRVCFIWRQISLSTPEFWASVSFNVTWRNRSRLIGIGKQWLSRAGAVPVSLHLHPDAFQQTISQINNLYDLLSHFQFRSLSLDRQYLELGELKGIFRRSANTLEKLHLRDMQRPIFFDPDDQLHSLTSLTLDGHLGHHILGAVASWDHLVHLSIHGPMTIPISLCFDILRQCCVIAVCRISVSETEDSTSEAGFPLPNIFLPELRLLDLTGSHRASKKLIAALSLPKLKDLYLRGSNAGLEMSTSDICGIIRRSDGMRHLEEFVIPKTEEALVMGEILACAPTLRKVSFGNGVLDEEAVHRLSTGGIGRRLEEIFTDSLHNVEKILQLVETRQMNASDSPSDNAQSRISPFRMVRIPCMPPTAHPTDREALRAHCYELGGSWHCKIDLV